MYPPELVKPMIEELTSVGFEELKTAAAVKQAILELVAGDNILLSLENNKVAISSNCLPSSGGVLTGDVINESKYVKNAKSIDATATGAGEDEETIVIF